MTPPSEFTSRLNRRLAVLALGFGALACSDDGAASDASTGSETTASDTGETETGGETVDCSDRPIELPAARGEIEGVWDAARGRMLVFAGDKGTPVQCMSQTDFVAEVWAFHPDCDNFERIDTGPGLTPRGRYAVALDAAHDRVLVHGGRWRDGTSGLYTVLDDLWAFDLATDTWTQLPAGASPRSNHVAAVIGDQLIVYGGNASNDGLNFDPLGDTWAFDLEAETWTELATTNDPPARLFHAATAGPQNSLIVFGGGDANAFIGPFFSDLWALQLDSLTWAPIAPANSGPPGTTWGDLVFDAPGNRLLHFAGHDDTQLGNVNTIWSFDLGGDGWSTLELGDVYNSPAAGFCDFPADFVVPDLDAPERRSAGATVLTDAGELMVFGGKTDCGLINDVWSWSLADATWTERSPASVGEICLRAFANCQTMCF